MMKEIKEADKQNSANVQYESYALEQMNKYAKSLSNTDKASGLEKTLADMRLAIQNKTQNSQNRVKELQEEAESIKMNLSKYLQCLPPSVMQIPLAGRKVRRLQCILHLNIARAYHEHYKYNEALLNGAKARMLAIDAWNTKDDDDYIDSSADGEESNNVTREDCIKALYLVSQNLYWLDRFQDARVVVKEALNNYNITAEERLNFRVLRHKMESAAKNLSTAERKILLEAATWAREAMGQRPGLLASLKDSATEDKRAAAFAQAKDMLADAMMHNKTFKDSAERLEQRMEGEEDKKRQQERIANAQKELKQQFAMQKKIRAQIAAEKEEEEKQQQSGGSGSRFETLPDEE